MRRIAILTVSAICIVLGLLTVWTPIPSGVPLLAVGIFLLLTVSPRAKKALRNIRTRVPRIDRGIEWVEARAHRSMAVTLKRTRPFRPKAKLVPVSASDPNRPAG